MLTSYERLRRREQNLVNLFIAICLDAPNELTADEIRRVVGSLPEEALVECLGVLKHRLQGNPDERAQAWSDKVRPWLENYWPPAAARNTSRTSEAMLDLLIECGGAFPDGVSWSLPHLKPIEGHGLYGLKKSDHVAEHSADVFQLLKQLVRGNVLPNWERHTHREILDALKEADHVLSADPEFQFLYGIATR